MPEIGSETESNSEERQIKAIAKDLCQQLGISYVALDTISWERFIPKWNVGASSRPMFKELSPDACIFEADRIILNRDLKGRLTPDEWKPVLASSLIYNTTLRSTLNLGIGIRVLLPLAFYILGWVLLWQSGIVNTYLQGAASFKGAPIPGGVAGFLFITGLFFVILFSGALLASPYVRKMKLTADSQARELVGREALEKVLEKIGEVGIDSKKRSRFATSPSIKERIANLQDSG